MDDGERNSKNFYEIQRIERDNVILSNDDDAGLLNKTTRIHPIIYILITNKLTNYYDLKYNYTIEEMLDLYELCMVNLHNKAVSIENNKK